MYEEEFGVFGGAPFGALIGDYEFGKTGRRTSSCWRRISQVAAAAHAPFLPPPSPKCSTWRASRSWTRRATLAKVFDTTEYAKWKALPASEDSRYVGLTLPRTS